MSFDALQAISPIDGRYRTKVDGLQEYFSEYALIKYRIYVEIEYFIALCKLPLPRLKEIGKEKFEALRHIYTSFDLDGAKKVKDYEKTTNHDIKAVEYFIKLKFDEIGLSEYKEFVHFGLTSQDVNNTATPMLLRDAMEKVYYPLLSVFIEQLKTLSTEWKSISMLAHTHGQPASPTKLGKEIMVFVERLEMQKAQLKAVPFSAKFGGATGNLNAHKVAYPDIDWLAFSNSFVNDTLSLTRSQVTTQIEHYDNLASLFDSLKRINTILIDFARDVWTYISMEYFKQKIVQGEVGSSTMPHKVNPIDFENAEGNLGIANALFEHLAAKLPISRLQRDLTDSTVLRNIGVPIGHTIIAFHSLAKGVNKLQVNEVAMTADLENNWAVVTEAIQTILRREGYPNPYEALKDLSRNNQKITKDGIVKFIDSLNVSEDVKKELKAINPHNYTGIY
ncbi:MAG: adenylosuccinate lyase [Bacteroidales bacterium]|nr:adenylosuccinate lyase [Bacteroidales bacterium]